MGTLNVRLFGRFALYQAEGEPISLISPKVQELFSYLLLEHRRPVPRETLLELFWKDSPPAQARRNLRQTLWQLQAVLANTNGDPGCPLINGAAACVQINPAYAMQIDVAAFVEAFERVRNLPGERLDDVEARALHSAATLYRGDLLEGCYQEWCLVERERLQTMYLAMLDKLMAFCEAHGSYERGLHYGEQALRYMRSSERVHRRLMRLLFFSGERAAALHQYERCAAILMEELDVEPSPVTTELYQRILEGRLDHAHDEARQRPALARAPADHTLLEIHERLRQLWVAVTTIQEQLRNDIQTVENAMHIAPPLLARKQIDNEIDMPRDHLIDTPLL